MPPRRRSVIHEYGEPLDAEMSVYALEETVAEKLRAILQHAEKLEHRGWSRSRARDYYDLWRVLQTYRDEMQLDDFRTFLTKKCAVRQAGFDGADAFFEPTVLAYVARTWENWLGPLVADLPPFDLVVEELGFAGGEIGKPLFRLASIDGVADWWRLAHGLINEPVAWLGPLVPEAIRSLLGEPIRLCRRATGGRVHRAAWLRRLPCG